MPTARQGSVRLFRFNGIDLFLHWSWFLVAVIEINGRTRSYSSLVWNVLEYLALFLIVMLHEFGHALACRQANAWPYSWTITMTNSARYSSTFQVMEE